MKWWMWLLIGVAGGGVATIIAALVIFYRTFRNVWG